MKFLRNLLIATTAVAAMTATAAFAEVTDTSFAVDKYNATANTISVTAADITALADDFGDQITVVIVPEGTTGVTEGNIYYINQDANGNASTMLVNMGMKTLDSAVKNYEVWIGGSNGTIKKASFSTSTGKVVYLGDANQAGGVEILDVIAILDHLSGLEGAALTGINAFAANANQAGGIEILDVIAILDHLSGIEGAALGTATYES